jgi:Tfp pilus assembly protein PilF
VTRKQNVIAVAMLAVAVAIGLSSCVELVAVGGAAYAPFHKPEALAKPYAMLRRHECSVADSEFSDFLETTPNDARAISGKADALVCLEKYDDAIANYSRAIELDPKWFDYFGRGIAYRAKGDLIHAQQNFDAGIAIAPTVPTLYVYRGVVQNARGDASGARADFEKVSALISNSRGSFNRYGWGLATSPISAYRDRTHGDTLRDARMRSDFMEGRLPTRHSRGRLRRSRAIRSGRQVADLGAGNPR